MFGQILQTPQQEDYITESKTAANSYHALIYSYETDLDC